ncbi:uncharacterized protein SPPG_01418 [Spizellomyces punctatus DAOM BR117]|uniref:Uncharacterized protein n=1 Tax=Spizellomyces punctatus (strain DAOM BR117) TaxID=645134 RepID=A0A0L0HSB0_SPIPD|nr:uncharacterized protein SPPG_01418 [Spizellomyces punctatus DAOM BR117]KND03967.1 hypothetical protein SPPG_01418 [Spizellomyces punctatus DAOM BR117]|eukprot:XP_016612006.1 hypothetical protein SPPG_01418 [Spizellomyces punctatus DAOM BR117]
MAQAGSDRFEAASARVGPFRFSSKIPPRIGGYTERPDVPVRSTDYDYDVIPRAIYNDPIQELLLREEGASGKRRKANDLAAKRLRKAGLGKLDAGVGGQMGDAAVAAKELDQLHNSTRTLSESQSDLQPDGRMIILTDWGIDIINPQYTPPIPPLPKPRIACPIDRPVYTASKHKSLPPSFPRTVRYGTWRNACGVFPPVVVRTAGRSAEEWRKRERELVDGFVLRYVKRVTKRRKIKAVNSVLAIPARVKEENVDVAVKMKVVDEDTNIPREEPEGQHPSPMKEMEHMQPEPVLVEKEPEREPEQESQPMEDSSPSLPTIHHAEDDSEAESTWLEQEKQRLYAAWGREESGLIEHDLQKVEEEVQMVRDGKESIILDPVPSPVTAKELAKSPQVVAVASPVRLKPSREETVEPGRKVEVVPGDRITTPLKREFSEPRGRRTSSLSAEKDKQMTSSPVEPAVIIPTASSSTAENAPSPREPSPASGLPLTTTETPFTSSTTNLPSELSISVSSESHNDLTPRPRLPSPTGSMVSIAASTMSRKSKFSPTKSVASLFKKSMESLSHKESDEDKAERKERKRMEKEEKEREKEAKKREKALEKQKHKAEKKGKNQEKLGFFEELQMAKTMKEEALNASARHSLVMEQQPNATDITARSQTEELTSPAEHRALASKTAESVETGALPIEPKTQGEEVDKLSSEAPTESIQHDLAEEERRDRERDEERKRRKEERQRIQQEELAAAAALEQQKMAERREKEQREEEVRKQEAEQTKERLEQQRIKKEQEEQERLEKQKAEENRLEAERKENEAREMQRREMERIEKERAQTELREKERAEKERLDQERREQELKDTEERQRRLLVEQEEAERRDRERDEERRRRREERERERLEKEKLENKREEEKKQNESQSTHDHDTKAESVIKQDSRPAEPAVKHNLPANASKFLNAMDMQTMQGTATKPVSAPTEPAAPPKEAEEPAHPAVEDMAASQASLPPSNNRKSVASLASIFGATKSKTGAASANVSRMSLAFGGGESTPKSPPQLVETVVWKNIKLDVKVQDFELHCCENGKAKPYKHFFPLELRRIISATAHGADVTLQACTIRKGGRTGSKFKKMVFHFGDVGKALAWSEGIMALVYGGSAPETASKGILVLIDKFDSKEATKLVEKYMKPIWDTISKPCDIKTVQFNEFSISNVLSSQDFTKLGNIICVNNTEFTGRLQQVLVRNQLAQNPASLPCEPDPVDAALAIVRSTIGQKQHVLHVTGVVLKREEGKIAGMFKAFK